MDDKNYKQLYEGTLEKAKQMKHTMRVTGSKMDPDMLDELFPQLVQMEDEEIRKELIVHLEQEYHSCTLDVNKSRWKAMLDYVNRHLPKNTVEPDENKVRQALIKCVENFGPANANPTLFKQMLDYIKQSRFKSVEEARAACEPDYVILKKKDYERLQKDKGWSDKEKEVIKKVCSYLNAYGNLLCGTNDDKANDVFESADDLKKL